MKTEIWADTRNASRCKSCGRRIEFAKNVKTGRSMPFDAPIVALRTRHDPGSHRLIEEIDLSTSHFASCPDAGAYRRRGMR